ncbi:hypothetical protein [Actinomadura miaoliensis]|uniref:Uncharacterized protein n=1 Tax=Actinomadura miaoliensis TaxID=430685 RepID=A0ABP7WZK4_9ACTN
MGPSADARYEELAERLLSDVIAACPALVNVRQAVWDADEHLAPGQRDQIVDATVAPNLAFWKGWRQAAINLLHAMISEVITNDQAVLPWRDRNAVILRIIDRLTRHDD